MTPETLRDPSRFDLLWTIEHAGIAEALRPFLWRRSAVAAAYAAANIVALGLVALAWNRAEIGPVEEFSTLCMGMAIGYLGLLPTHEGVHALAYRALGAGSVTVRYQWRTLTAFCAADRFVIDGRGLAWVCLAPFLALNPPLAAAAVLSPGRWGLLAAGALLLHVGACSGDFALVNWVRLAGRSPIFTYDDVAAGRTSFFGPIASGVAPPDPPSGGNL